MDRPKLTLSDVGIDEQDVADAWAMIEAGARDKYFGGAVALIRRQGQVVWSNHTGYAVREPEAEKVEMAEDTIFDLASLTKVTATLPCILKLVENNKISLDQPIGSVLTEFGTEGRKRQVTIGRVLSHSSGLVSWRGVFTTGSGIDAYIENYAADQPSHTPGQKVIYSDPGFIMLGEIVHRVSGKPLDEFAKAHVFDMLRMVDTEFTPPASKRDRIAATEQGDMHERVMARKVPAGGAWRDYLLRGEVHDGNAWHGLHGLAGHAGLFGTAHDLGRYGQMWLNGGVLDGARILRPETIAEAMREQTGLSAPNDRRGLGWQMAPRPNEKAENHSGLGLSQRAVGHTGFTGTSLWIDPDRDLVLVLMTNRVHPTVSPAYLPIRAEFTKAIAEACA